MFLILLFPVLAGFVAWGQVNKRLYNDGFSPFNLLFYFWVLPFSLRLFGLSSYESEWDLNTVLVLFWVTVCLAFTCIVPALLMKHYSFSVRRPIFERTMTLFRSKPLI